MKQITLISCIVLLASLAQSQTFSWAKSFGGVNTSISPSDEGRAITFDGSGNAYTTGSFVGTVDLDPGPGISSYSTATTSAYNMFVQKLDASGSFVWGFGFGNGPTVGNAICIDGSGDVYITGFFLGTVDFDPSSSTANLTSTCSGVDF